MIATQELEAHGFSLTHDSIFQKAIFDRNDPHRTAYIIQFDVATQEGKATLILPDGTPEEQSFSPLGTDSIRAVEAHFYSLYLTQRYLPQPIPVE